MSLACPDCKQVWPPQQGPWYICHDHQTRPCPINGVIQIAAKRGWNFRPDHFPLVWESPFGCFLNRLPREVYYQEDL